MNLKDKGGNRNSNRSSSITSEKQGKKRKQAASSLPPLTNTGAQSPHKGSLTGNLSKKSIEDITENMVMDRDS